MKNIQPITALRNTATLEEDLKEIDGPLFITKNGYSDLVILSPEYYESLIRGRKSDFTRSSTKEETPISAPQSDPMGFVKVAAFTTPVEVCGVSHNEEEIKKAVIEANKIGVKVLVLPELCLTGYTCGDMFFSATLHQAAERAIKELESWSKDYDVLFVYGAPLSHNNSYYNCAIVTYKGKILGVVPKSNLPNYCEFYEKRHFQEAPKENGLIEIGGVSYPFGTKFLFVDMNYLKLKIAVEVCEDLWVPDTPSTKAALAGADLILNLSASNEVVGKKEYRDNLVAMTSARLYSAYVYSDAGDGESTTDLVFSGHNIVAENGKILAESPLFSMEGAISEVDLERVLSERRKTTSFGNVDEGFESIYFSMPLSRPELTRHYAMNPFIPESKEIDLDLVKLILTMQAMGLVKRLKTIHASQVFVGLSGGLDSTLALLVCVEAFKKANLPLKGIHAITLPAFGTSERTLHNASLLASELGVSFETVDIKESLLAHFKDIDHNPVDHNVTYENAQARTRTMVLMDIANDKGGLMVGTGDLSELCLGWTTYAGDHMSMYGVNASIPKTMVRYLVEGYAILHKECADSLLDIVATPISPELLPTDKQGGIAQKTEDKIGPYELNDFFIYHFLRFGFRPGKLFFLAKEAYKDKYDDETIKKWLRSFFNRFFHNEFKRSCLPDGAKVGTVAISPRGDLRMPSDACVDDYLKEVDAIETTKTSKIG
jgi:NAD+ synthase (glutamine-hydrolysing)